MSFGDHLEDLRRRLLLGLLGVVPLFVVAFALGRPILELLIDPAQKKLQARGQATSLLATGPFETFGTVVQIAFVSMILLGSPWLLYQLWKFVAPGLYAYERRFVRVLVPMSMVLTALSVVFLYFVILPVILQFFIGYASQIKGMDPGTAAVPAGVVLPVYPVLEHDPAGALTGQVWFNESVNQLRMCVGMDEEGDKLIPIVRGVEMAGGAGVVQQYRISEYIKTLLNMGLAFGIGFQMPVVVLMLGWLGIVGGGELRRFRKHIFGACFVAGALLTPADPLSMVLLAVPLYALFELGLMLLRVLPAERVAGVTREGPGAEADDG